MSVRIEFFGIPRARAGIASLEVEACTLGEALRAAGRFAPEFAAACLRSDGSLHAGAIANINGHRFVRETATPLTSGDSVLILSADAGG